MAKIVFSVSSACSEGPTDRLRLTEERADGGRSHTALLLDREGRPAARYRKTHLLPDDDGLTPGDDLPVVRTDFGLLGFSLTSEIYFPEVYWTAAMKGAEADGPLPIVLWQSAPERFRQHHDLPALLKARCLDGHVHMVTAMVADPRTYGANRYEISIGLWAGMVGFTAGCGNGAHGEHGEDDLCHR